MGDGKIVGIISPRYSPPFRPTFQLPRLPAEVFARILAAADDFPVDARDQYDAVERRTHCDTAGGARELGETSRNHFSVERGRDSELFGLPALDGFKMVDGGGDKVDVS